METKRSLNDYRKIDKIGEGTYGIVYKGEDLKTGQFVAMKKIRLEAEEEGIPSTAVREISMLKELRHASIVCLEDVIMQENRLYLIFEYLPMDLKRFLDNLDKDKMMDPSLVRSFLYQITQGIAYCHQRRILHRDLKPQNLLVDVKSNVIKLADFGLARVVGIPIRAYTHEVVTLWYRSPEILLGSPRYSTGVDIWSMGCIFAEMVRKKPLFQGDSEIDQLFRIFKILTTPSERVWKGFEQMPEFKGGFPKWEVDCLDQKMKDAEFDQIGMGLLRDMLRYDPADRIQAKHILKHPYFDELDRATLPDSDYDGTLVLD